MIQIGNYQLLKKHLDKIVSCIKALNYDFIFGHFSVIFCLSFCLKFYNIYLINF